MGETHTHTHTHTHTNTTLCKLTTPYVHGKTHTHTHTNTRNLFPHLYFGSLLSVEQGGGLGTSGLTTASPW